MTFFRGLRQEWPLPVPSRRTCTPDEHGSSPGFRRESGAPVCVNNSGGGYPAFTQLTYQGPNR